MKDCAPLTSVNFDTVRHNHGEAVINDIFNAVR